MASFPTSIITTATLVTPTANQPTNNPSHSNAHVLLNGELIAVETTLGTNPQGSYATVSAALTTHGTLITAAQTTANTAVTAASVAQTTANSAATAASAAQSTANTAVTLANAAQTTANARATYPGAGVPLSTGSAWGSSYTVGTAASNIVQLTTGGFVVVGNISGLLGVYSQNTLGANYHATTDVFVTGYVNFTNTGHGIFTCYIGTSSSSTTTVLTAIEVVYGANANNGPFSFYVPKSYFWQVTGTATSGTANITINSIPLGS